MTGETFGAGGPAGLSAALLAMENSFIPPTINYTTPDPECDLDYVPNTARHANIKTALVNSISIDPITKWGNCVSLMIKAV
jgi:3-oxoacyl-[acyl-carrier-protein] synthase II